MTEDRPFQVLQFEVQKFYFISENIGLQRQFEVLEDLNTT